MNIWLEILWIVAGLMSAGKPSPVHEEACGLAPGEGIDEPAVLIVDGSSEAVCLWNEDVEINWDQVFDESEIGTTSP